jgi:prevent-host-death family protein
MKLSEQIRPLSHLEAHASEMIAGLAEHPEPVVITVDGEAKAVLQDIASYERTQEALALLKLLALSNKDVEDGKVYPVHEVFAGIRSRVKPA